MTDFVFHFLIFSVVVVVGLVLPLTIGRFLRPKLPTPEKDAIYECGEPTIGTSYIQFDLRFYVVALLFIIFDVEIVFFFPWAMVYGGAVQLSDNRLTDEARHEISAKLLNVETADISAANLISPEAAQSLMMVGLADILVFFGVLLVCGLYWEIPDIVFFFDAEGFEKLIKTI